MIAADDLRSLTERQREVLSIVVENKLYKNKDTAIPDIAEQLGIAPVAVYKHILEIEKGDLCTVTVSPSEKGTKIYERLSLQPRPARRLTAEALSEPRRAILLYLSTRPDATSVELAEELGMSEYAVNTNLRVLEAISLVTKQRGRAIKRGVPPYVYNATAHGQSVLR
ncbi:MAG: winged helix-turn-helix transcriptional regulator [Methanobacteriota archaeon]|nr:MAG: winged helix-turn-helix transcriptional regulator [Euryarchaeota archaeon]